MTAQLEPRECINCDKVFIPRRPNQLKHDPRCCRNRGRNKHKARIARSHAHAVRFIGVDGEGITIAGSSPARHDYVLLSCGQNHLHMDGARIGFLDIMPFLYECYRENSDACFVGFYLGYDFAQWLCDLPAERAAMLLTDDGIAKRRRRVGTHLPPFPVEYEGWEFDGLGMRRFRLRPAGLLPGSSPSQKKRNPWMTINDAGPFFQSSFLAAIDPAKSQDPIVTQAEYQIIEAGKAGRGADKFGPDMIAYNQLECEVLARLMTRQNEGLVAEDIRLAKHQWFGPGQASQKWLYKIKAPKGEQIRDAVPDKYRDAARQSYYGGWFDIHAHGPLPGQSWHYDINSAYPYIMSKLPCLLHGIFSERNDWHHLGTALQLTYCAVKGSHPWIGAMLHRTRQGRILRPRETEGWYWRHELESALGAGIIDRVDIKETLTYIPCDCPPPLAPIAELYQGRLRVGKNTPAGRARRLIYNSAYGKFAQSVGEPVFANAVYASLITAGCRVMILDAMRSHPTSSPPLMVATDGVVFSNRHTGLDIDDQRLGAWTEGTYENLSLFMPGLYWDDESRARIARAEAPVFKSRGINARDLARRLATIDRAWSRFDRDGWPRLMLPVGFSMVSAKQALARGKWELCGTVVDDGRRIISADPKGKRCGGSPGKFSRPYQGCNPVVSTPYERKFGDELADYEIAEFGDHPDGPISSVLLRELWR